MIDVNASMARKPWVAAVLPLFCTGLGHIYCGRIVTGLTLFLASLMFAPVVVVVSLMEPSTPLLVALILCVLLVLGAYAFACVDAYRVARRVGTDYQPREYNRGFVYALFMLVGVIYPALVLTDLRARCFEAFAVPSASESPNILPGDHILANKRVVSGNLPRRGDVVVFHAPDDRRVMYVKRVIGLPGDTVAVRSGRVYLNGKPLERDRVSSASLPYLEASAEHEVYSENNTGRRYLTMVDPSAGPVADCAEQTVPATACFVLGDHRNRSRDSRAFGTVPLGDVTGVVQYIYRPAESWSRFGAFRDQ